MTQNSFASTAPVGLGQVIPTKDMVSAILDTYVDKHQTRLAPVLAKLCGDGCLRPTGDDWDTIRLRVSNVDFREMMVKVIELRGNGLKGTMKFLCDVFRPSENFEVSECIRMILESAWILDFLPTKKKKARQFLHDTVLTVFPFAKKPVDDFVIDYLGLEPLPSVIPAKKEHLSSSSDSDVESRGSLDDFVVDEDEDDEGEEDDEESEVSGSSGSESSGSSESESSDSSESSADEKQIRKKTDKKRRKTVSSSSSNSD